jgi:uncharacterized protein (DUF433 family)
MIDECLLDRVQLVGAGNSLDRSYLTAIHLCNRNEATVHNLSIEDDGTGAALAFTTTLLGPGKLQLFTQHVEQPRHGKDLQLARLAIDPKLNCAGDGHSKEYLKLLTHLPGADGKHNMYSMLDWSNCPEVERVEGKVSGAWVFKGTRVPVKALFENLESGATIEQFLAWFPGVTLNQAVAVLSHAEQSLAEV